MHSSSGFGGNETDSYIGSNVRQLGVLLLSILEGSKFLTLNSNCRYGNTMANYAACFIELFNPKFKNVISESMLKTQMLQKYVMVIRFKTAVVILESNLFIYVIVDLIV
jgi:hypothetical protein